MKEYTTEITTKSYWNRYPKLSQTHNNKYQKKQQENNTKQEAFTQEPWGVDVFSYVDTLLPTLHRTLRILSAVQLVES